MRKPGRVWYRRCGADFIAGTMGLSLEEKGAYSLCLDLIYDHQGPIPDDARWLAGICNVSVRRWTAIRDRLVFLGKLVPVDGFLTNIRAENELRKDAEISGKLAENGSKGGNKSAENRSTSNEINDVAEAKSKPHARRDKIREDKIISNVSSDEDTKPRDALSILSDVLDLDRSKAVLQCRRSKKLAVTDYAIGLLVASLRACPDPNLAADEMILRGWSSVKPEWLDRDRPKQQAPPRKSAHVERHDEARRILEESIMSRRQSKNEHADNAITIDHDDDWSPFGTIIGGRQ